MARGTGILLALAAGLGVALLAGGAGASPTGKTNAQCRQLVADDLVGRITPAAVPGLVLQLQQFGAAEAAACLEQAVPTVEGIAACRELVLDALLRDIEKTSAARLQAFAQLARAGAQEARAVGNNAEAIKLEQIAACLDQLAGGA